MPTDEQIEKAAKAVERINNPQWNDEQFEAWWNHSFFTDSVTAWNGFRGTRREKALRDAKVALLAAKGIS